jgi:hypothetical protein
MIEFEVPKKVLTLARACGLSKKLMQFPIAPVEKLDLRSFCREGFFKPLNFLYREIRRRAKKPSSETLVMFDRRLE